MNVGFLTAVSTDDTPVPVVLRWYRYLPEQTTVGHGPGSQPEVQKTDDAGKEIPSRTLMNTPNHQKTPTLPRSQDVHEHNPPSNPLFMNDVHER